MVRPNGSIYPGLNLKDPKSKRRGCAFMAAAVALFVLLAIAIGSGWLGHRTGRKSPLIVPQASQTAR